MNFVTDTHDATGTTSIADLSDRLGDAPTVLAVWAHPDDEAYLGGGLLASVARTGGTVVNVSATLGEHGTDDPVRLPPTRLRAVRRQELAAALDALGAAGSYTLDIEDGTCDRTTAQWGAHRLGQMIDSVRPDAIVTFGHDGVTGHGDHRAVARWVELAVRRRGDHVPVIATAATEAWSPALIDRMHTVSMFYPGYPEAVDDPSVTVAHLDPEVLDRKLTALAAHASQVGPLHTALGDDGYRQMAAVEAYRAANRPAALLLGSHPALDVAA